jgi:hypothetical protein
MSSSVAMSSAVDNVKRIVDLHNPDIQDKILNTYSEDPSLITHLDARGLATVAAAGRTPQNREIAQKLYDLYKSRTSDSLA